MNSADNLRQKTWKILRRIAALFRGRFPTWAVMLLVLFGGGGIFYAAHDFLKKQQSRPPSVYDGAPALPVSIEASFFPNYATTMLAGVSVEVTDSGNVTLPNLKLVFDAGNARLESCEVRAADKILSSPVRIAESIYVVKLQELLPNERIQLYCLANNPQKVLVTMNVTDLNGKSLGFAEQTFERSSEKQGSGFYAFIDVIGGIILVALAGCIIYLLFGVAGRLAAWLGLFRDAQNK